MTGPRRAAVTSGDEILSEIADLLIEIRDRLPQPTQAERSVPDPGPVEVSEPAPKRAPTPADPTDGAVEVAEPDPPKMATRRAAPTKRAPRRG